MLVVLTALVASLLVGVPAGARAPAFPDVLPLPDGFYPEGITIGTGQDFYVGSLLDGALYRGDLRTGQGEVIADGAPGRWLVGLDHNARSGLVWGAGIDGGAGAVLAFDAATDELAHVVPIPDGAFLNDLVVTRTAVYVTDSFAPLVWNGVARRRGASGRDRHRDSTTRWSWSAAEHRPSATAVVMVGRCAVMVGG